MVVPLRRTQPYYARRMPMKAEWVCPWRRNNPIIKYGDGAAHAYEMNRYRFVAWLVDFSVQGPVVLTPPVMVGRQKVLVEVGTSRRTQPAKKKAMKQGWKWLYSRCSMGYAVGYWRYIGQASL